MASSGRKSRNRTFGSRKGIQQEVIYVPEHKEIEISRPGAGGQGAGASGAAVCTKGDGLSNTIESQRGSF